MADIIQIRRDTYNNWIEVDPILAQAEFAVEVDTNQFKIGDGKEVYSALPYASQGVPRPNPQDQDKWMVYNDASKSWAVATTDLIETNSTILFGNARGVFKDIIVPTLDTQLEVNRWLLEQIEEVYEGHFVKTKGGDEMQGPLKVTGGRSANADGVEGTIKALNIDSGQQGSLQLRYHGATKVYVGDKQTTINNDLKLNNNGGSIYSGDDDDKKGLVVETDGIRYEGSYTDDQHLATKKNVTDAIAAAAEDKEGLFAWDASSTDLPLGTWQFEGKSNPSYTEPGVQVINIQKTSKNGITFTPSDFVVDGQIEIKNVDNNDYLLGTVTNIVDGGPKSIQITFNRDTAAGSAVGDQRITSVAEASPYVNKTGDEMTGELKMKGSRIIFNNISDNGQVIRANRSQGESVDLLYLAHGGGSTAGYYDIRMTGNTSYNGVRFKGGSGGDEPIFEMRANGNYNVFYSDLRFDGNRIRELGDAVDDTDAVSYGQVKQELSDKFEEITATLSFGNFSYVATSIARGIGVLTGFGAWPNTNGEKNPANIGSLGVHHSAGDGSEVDWPSLSIGDIIRWSRGTNVWQFRVNGTPLAQESDDNLWYQVPVNQGSGPTFIESGIGNFDYTLSLLKLTGGSADLDDYLKIDASNGPLTGNLEINQGVANKEAGLKLKGDRPNTNNSAATITFENAKSTDIGYLTYRSFGSEHFFRFNQDVDLNNKGLHSAARVRLQSGGTIESGTSPRLKFKDASGAQPGDGLLEVVRPANNRRGFTIRGNGTDGTETDMLYTYTNPSGPDAINYAGKMDGSTNLVTLGKVQELIRNGGGGADGDGEVFQRHGPYRYIPGNGGVSPGEFTADNAKPKLIKQLTFNKKNANGEDDPWSNLAAGEVMTLIQASGDNYLIINYTVKELFSYNSAFVASVDAHQTIIAYSDGTVVYNPADAFSILTDVDTYTVESQPATINNVVDLANKASPGPAFNSYKLQAGTGEPIIGGIKSGNFIAAGTSNIQTPTRFIFSGSDLYGNGLKFGPNSVTCPGSTVELYRKNGDGSLCLCKIYEFNKLYSFGNDKFELQNLVEKQSTLNGNTFIPSPGTLEANAEYLVRHHLNLSDTVYTVDEDGDPHYGDHPLEDVGYPVAATDAATKGYVDSVAGGTSGGSDLPVFKFASKEIEELGAGQFVCLDSSNNITAELARIRAICWKGTDDSGSRPIRDTDAITYDSNLNSAFSLLITKGTKLILRASMGQTISGHPLLSYMAAYDVYCVAWNGGDITTITSNFIKFTNSISVSFHCPELFF